MGAPSWTLPWIGFLAFAIIGQLLLCGGEAPDTSAGNILVTIFGLITGTYCDELWPMVSFLLFLTITVPGLLLLYGLIEPLFSGTTAGLAVGLVALLTLGGFFVGFLILI